MSTVPVGVADLLLAERPDLRAALAGCGRQLGARVEVDLDAVAALAGPQLAELLARYSLRSQNLWTLLARTGASGGNTVLHVTRTLGQHAQVTGKLGRADLNEMFAALTAVPGLDELTETATEAVPDLSRLAQLAGSLDGTLTSGDGHLEVSACLSGLHALPELLGGLPWPGEVARTLTLSTRQAGWRDRRVRRLASVEVSSSELWPAVDDLATALAAVRPRLAGPARPQHRQGGETMTRLPTPVSRRMAARFTPGTRVVATDGQEPIDRHAKPRRFGTLQGTVVRFVPSGNAQGGTVVVQWDSGVTGRNQPVGLALVSEVPS